MESHTITPQMEPAPPTVPMDLSVAIAKGIVRTPTHIVSTISDDRGEEPHYGPVGMSELIEKDCSIGDVSLCLSCGLGGYLSHFRVGASNLHADALSAALISLLYLLRMQVISLLWFKRQLPKYATKFIELYAPWPHAQRGPLSCVLCSPSALAIPALPTRWEWRSRTDFYPGVYDMLVTGAS